MERLKLVHSQRGSISVPDEDFRTLAKYLLFALPAIPLPTSGAFETKVMNAMHLQGKKENIMVWCFPTPEQKYALLQNRVLFLSAWGTGKTLLMTTKAIDLATTGKKVLYLLFMNGEKYSMNSLLFLI